MASAVTSCAPCVFGALATSLLSLPYDIVGTINVLELPQTFTINGSVSTSILTSTLDVPQTSFIIGPPGASQSIVPVTIDGANPTWSTLGTVLTYPTTYVQYLAFQGIAVTSPATACAQTLAPSALFLPASTTAASFIYPQDDSTDAIPTGLLDYLDADGGIPAQLASDQLTMCAAVGAPPVTASTVVPNITLSISLTSKTTSELATSTTVVSTSFSTSITTLTSMTTTETTTEASTAEGTPSSSSAETLSTTLETLMLTSKTSVPATATSFTVVTTQTVTKTPALVINTLTGLPIITTTTTSSVAASAAAETVSTDSAPSELISNLYSVLESLATLTLTASLSPGPYANTTSTITAPAGPVITSAPPSGGGSGNVTSTSYTVPYDNAAPQLVRESLFGGMLGLLVVVLML